MVFVDGRNAQKHKNDRFRRAAQHFHGILDGRMRFVRNVGLHVIFHRDTTKGYSKMKKYMYLCRILLGLECR